MAFLFLGLLRERIRIEPEWGAGMLRIFIKGADVVLWRT